jgi:hypothetical protein
VILGVTGVLLSGDLRIILAERIGMTTFGSRTALILGGRVVTRVAPYPGALKTPGYQCVEFSERYGVTMGLPTDGDQVAEHYAAKYPALFMIVKSGDAAVGAGLAAVLGPADHGRGQGRRPHR